MWCNLVQIFSWMLCRPNPQVQEVLAWGYCYQRWFNQLFKHCCHYFFYHHSICLMGVFKWRHERSWLFLLYFTYTVKSFLCLFVYLYHLYHEWNSLKDLIVKTPANLNDLSPHFYPWPSLIFCRTVVKFLLLSLSGKNLYFLTEKQLCQELSGTYFMRKYLCWITSKP